VSADADWWRNAVVYQIYPRSFADGNGDGIGDLPGILSRVPYLASLGIDAVWLSPFYPSALADGGYDIDDPRAVDPRLGTIDDFDELATALAGENIRLIVDIVPNHSSNAHRWFLEALDSPAGSPARGRYHFRDGLGASGELPPADWPSGFGGLMWTRVPDGQWYLHIHTAEQPDLNWDHEEVRADYLDTLRFWADRGVSGFRIDVAHLLAKELPDELLSHAVISGLPPGQHPLQDRDEVHAIYADWRKLFDEYDPPLTAVAEAWVDHERRAAYASAASLGQAFNFDLLQANWDAAEFRNVIKRNLHLASTTGSSSTWVLSNHDVVRHASRYGLPPTGKSQDGREWLLSDGESPRLDPALGERRARAATLLLLGLPGSAYLYQGEELGLHEVAGIPASLRQDSVFLRTGGADPGRDGCRVPLPWTPDGPSLGFSVAEPHLPQPEWFRSYAFAVEAHDPQSTLQLYRRALAARRWLLEDATDGDLTWHEGDAQVLHFERGGGWQVITTFETSTTITAGEIMVASANLHGRRTIPPGTTAWVKV
jgi:alpha-glucosidase